MRSKVLKNSWLYKLIFMIIRKYTTDLISFDLWLED